MHALAHCPVHDLVELEIEEALREAAALARTDLYTFSRQMFMARKGYAWRRAKQHQIICDALMRVYRGECKRLIINVPPRYSKTELAVVNFIAWCFGHAPDSEFIHASYSGTLAVNNSTAIRGLMTHEHYGRIFPGVQLASNAQHHWTTTAGGVMYAVGAGGTITGFGAGKHRDGFGGALILDDLHKADEARSDVIRTGVIDWFQNTLESRKNSPDTPIILIMQRLHEDDLAGFLLGDRGPDMSGPPVPGGNGEVWEHLFLDVWQKDDHGNEVPLWPEKHSADDLRRMEQANPYVFAGQYRQRPAPPTGGVIKPDMLQEVDVIPPGVVQWCRGWDLAASDGAGDWTAGVKVGQLQDGRFILAGAVHEQFATDQRDKLIKTTADNDGPGKVMQSLPQDPGQAGKSQVQSFAKLLAGHNLHFSPESGDKVTRADPLASQINAGNVLAVRGPWLHKYKTEARIFPNGKHDDLVDASSRGFNALLQQKRFGIHT